MSIKHSMLVGTVDGRDYWIYDGKPIPLPTKRPNGTPLQDGDWVGVIYLYDNDKPFSVIDKLNKSKIVVFHKTDKLVWLRKRWIVTEGENQ